jgi:SHS2 domain-containing protein
VQFELLDHPADIGFRARGGNLPELFANAAQALVFILLDSFGIEPCNEISISVAGADYESLLVNWLNEVLYYVDCRGFALGAFEILRLDDTRIEAIARGEPRDPQKHPAKIVVKGVTYHQLKIGHQGADWIAEVYVDV